MVFAALDTSIFFPKATAEGNDGDYEQGVGNGWNGKTKSMPLGLGKVYCSVEF